MKKQNTIKPLFDLPDSEELFAHFNSLILQKKYADALNFGKSKKTDFASTYNFYIGLAICYSGIEKPKEALKTLIEAAAIFPNNSDIYYYLGSAYFDVKNYEDSEKCFLRSLELFPESKKIERSECLNNLGILYWNDLRREEAVNSWKASVKENPFNNKALENIKEFVNEYGEPKASNQLFDDLYHFQNIHKKKYFELTAKNKFDSIEETEDWFEIVTKKWHDTVETILPEIGSMTSSQRTTLYESVTIDYSTIGKKLKSKKKSPKETSKSFRKGFSFVDEVLLQFIPLTIPILTIYGLEKERFEEIAGGAKATEDEEDLFFWAFDFLELILEASTDVSAAEKKSLLLEAEQIALEYLDEDDAEDAIRLTRELCHDLFRDLASIKLNKDLGKNFS